MKNVIIRFSSKDQLVMRRRGGGEGETEGRDRRRALECWRRFLQAFNKHHLDEGEVHKQNENKYLVAKIQALPTPLIIDMYFPASGKGRFCRHLRERKESYYEATYLRAKSMVVIA
jgi:hypothetical protein